MEDARNKCQVLAKGKDSDLAKDAMEKLKGAGNTRIAIRRTIDEKLQLIASKLKDLDAVSNDGASQIQDAQRGVDVVLGLLDQLKREQGEDSEAKQIADRWPDQAKALREAINSYKMLKAGQNYLDPELRNCQAELGGQKDFLAQRTSLSGRNDPASPDQIRSNAADIQKRWQARSENAAAMGRNLANYNDKVAAFSVRDGAWS